MSRFVEVPLANTDLVALVVEADAERVLKYSWHVNRSRTGRIDCAQARVNNRIAIMHRFILELQPGDKPVDHLNGNTLDNRRSNLRLATTSQNNINSPLRANNTSGYRGVSWFKPHRKWKAQTSVNRRLIHLGYFDDPKAAAHAYDAKIRELHGEFACVNFPLPGERPAREEVSRGH